MKNDLGGRSGVPQRLSRRKFIRAAAATGGAGILSAGLAPISAQGSAMKAAQLVLPTATKDVTPFKVHVPQAALNDLKKKLANARWPDKEPVTDWSQGVPLAKAQSLVEYWRTRYDWRLVESTLNGLPQFRAQIDGLGIHFIHVRSKHESALPIILTHGWPGSVLEFLQVIEPLVDPTAHGGKADEAFHVVIPSLPGFGFSDKPTQPGWRLPRIANAWAELMARLGYRHYVAQGGDWGACGRNELDGQAAAFRACRGPSESSDPLSTTATTTRRLYGRRTNDTRSTGQVRERWDGLCLDPWNASSDTGVRSGRLTGWAGNVDL